MNIVIPVAGYGTRLRPHTYTAAKSMLPVAGKPILGHILDPLVDLEPSRLVIITGFYGDQVREFVDSTYDLDVTYVHQEELLGLGYAIGLGLKELPDEPVLIILGDTIVDTDYKKLLAKGDNVLGLMEVDDPRRFGIAEIENGTVRRLVEKPDDPKSNLAVIGLYFVSETALLRDQIDILVAKDKRTKDEYQLTDALAAMIDKGVKFVPYTVNSWYDCGKPDTLLATNRRLLDKMNVTSPATGSVVIPPCHVAPSATIERSVIGPHVTVAKETVIRNSIIKDSIIGAGAVIEEAILSGSLVGNGARVYGGCDCLNIGDSTIIGAPQQGRVRR
jgi:glucose-1-phosphate thymidylyltransferase